MYGEILKYGAQIVDALVDYKHPIFVYIPPNGELRGGSWVVVDPVINKNKMEMYADTQSRGGILEPPGIVEVKYRKPQQLEAMRRCDDKLKELDPVKDAEQIATRETQLLPLYTSIAEHFADLHDRAERMKQVGVIRQALEWKNARRFFYWRVKRRVLEDHLAGKMQGADSRFSYATALEQIQQWLGAAKDDDQAATAWLEKEDFEVRIKACRTSFVVAEIEALMADVDESERAALFAQR